MIERIRDVCNIRVYRSYSVIRLPLCASDFFKAVRKSASGLRGNVGGSVSDQGYQDVWISGGSVRYDYEDKPW